MLQNMFHKQLSESGCKNIQYIICVRANESKSNFETEKKLSTLSLQ